MQCGRWSVLWREGAIQCSECFLCLVRCFWWPVCKDEGLSLSLSFPLPLALSLLCSRKVFWSSWIWRNSWLWRELYSQTEEFLVFSSFLRLDLMWSHLSNLTIHQVITGLSLPVRDRLSLPPSSLPRDPTVCQPCSLHSPAICGLIPCLPACPPEWNLLKGNWQCGLLTGRCQFRFGSVLLVMQAAWQKQGRILPDNGHRSSCRSHSGPTFRPGNDGLELRAWCADNHFQRHWA